MVLVDKHPSHVIATSTHSVDGLVFALLGGGSQHSDPSRRMQTMPSFRIQQIVTRLLTDKVLRLRFEHDRLSVLGELQEQGAALTANELDLFM